MPLRGKPRTKVRLNPLSCGFMVRFEGEWRSQRDSPGGWLSKNEQMILSHYPQEADYARK